MPLTHRAARGSLAISRHTTEALIPVAALTVKETTALLPVNSWVPRIACNLCPSKSTGYERGHSAASAQQGSTFGTRPGGAGEHPRALSGPPASPVRAHAKRPWFRRTSAPPTYRGERPSAPARPSPGLRSALGGYRRKAPHTFMRRAGLRTDPRACTAASPPPQETQPSGAGVAQIGFPRPCSPPRPLDSVVWGIWYLKSGIVVRPSDLYPFLRSAP
jgi:hypothetical protein